MESENLLFVDTLKRSGSRIVFLSGLEPHWPPTLILLQEVGNSRATVKREDGPSDEPFAVLDL